MKEIKIPELAESITEGTVAQLLKKVGESIEKGESIAEIETDKVNIEITSEESGIVSQLLVEPGETVHVGQVIAILEDRSQEVQKEPQDSLLIQTIAPEKQRPIASPAARKKARELGIDINEVPFRDPLGRVRVEGVEAAYKYSIKPPEPVKQEESIVNQLKSEDKKTERIKMTRRRQTIAKRLVEAQHTAAMLTTFNEVDMSAIIELRNRRKESFYNKHGVKLGFMSFFTKAVIGALKAFPFLNAEIQSDEIVLKRYYDIGIAVSTDEGLVVPIVRNADQLSFVDIEKEILHLSEKARSNTLQLQDLQGGTFTITNGGVFGSLFSTPILNTPQVGILGMHAIQRRPVVVDDKDTIEVRPMMYIALSYDHRIIDGKDAVQFLIKVKQLLENPEDLLLEG